MKSNSSNLSKSLKHGSFANTQKPKAVIYVSAKSCDSTHSHKSALAQFTICNQFIKKMGWKLINVYQDNGYPKNRQYVKTDIMTQDILDSKFDYIVSTSINRLPQSLLITLSGLVQKIEPTDVIPPKCYLVSPRKFITDSFLRKYCTYEIKI